MDNAARLVCLPHAVPCGTHCPTDSMAEPSAAAGAEESAQKGEAGAAFTVPPIEEFAQAPVQLSISWGNLIDAVSFGIAAEDLGVGVRLSLVPLGRPVLLGLDMCRPGQGDMIGCFIGSLFDVVEDIGAAPGLGGAGVAGVGLGEGAQAVGDVGEEAVEGVGHFGASEGA